VKLLSIWRKSGKTIIFVMHDIAEAVLLGTRAIVLTARMAENIPIMLPAERTHEAFGAYTRHIYRLLGVQ
jgi:NitT/TauT family transport system ATP-binding protein